MYFSLSVFFVDLFLVLLLILCSSDGSIVHNGFITRSLLGVSKYASTIRTEDIISHFKEIVCISVFLVIVSTVT